MGPCTSHLSLSSKLGVIGGKRLIALPKQPDPQPRCTCHAPCAARPHRFDADLIQEPTVYRLYEAVMHNGEAIKALVNEECGDGIMSAIDVYASMDTVVGKHVGHVARGSRRASYRRQIQVCCCANPRSTGGSVLLCRLPQPGLTGVARCLHARLAAGREARRHHAERQIPALCRGPRRGRRLVSAQVVAYCRTCLFISS